MPGFTAATTRHPSAIAKKLRVAVGVSMVVLALAATVPHAVAQTQSPPPSSGGTSQLTAAEALNALTQAVGGNAALANQLVQALGGDPVTALNAFVSGNASSSLASALGGSAALQLLTQGMGGDNALSALTGALGQNGSLNALVNALGGTNAVGSLAGSLIGNTGAISALQSMLSGNTAGLQALSAFLGGDTGALGALTSALGGTNGALSALTGAIGIDGALSSLTGSLGLDGALGALADALGISGALNALTGMIGEQISELLGELGLSAVCGVAPLTGTFATQACAQTADNRAIEYVKEEPGGKEVAKKIEETHTDRLLPALKDSTAQLSAGVSDATRQMGSIADAAQMADAKRDIQNQELGTRKGLQQHEQSCALPSNAPALAQTLRGGTALQRALALDAKRRANPVPGTDAGRGYPAVIAKRYENYCRYFIDPNDNNSVSACKLGMQGGTPPDDPPNLAERPDGDIDIEGILLKDTIDIDDEPTRLAVEALMDNLVQPKPYPRLPEEQMQSAIGKEWTVKKERLETLRELSATVIGGIVARRVGIPLPEIVAEGAVSNTMEGGPENQCNIPNTPGDANSKTLNFAQSNVGKPYISPKGMTYCQRFSYHASHGTPPPAQGGGNAGSAKEAWDHFRAMKVAQSNFDDMRPGDLIYLKGRSPVRANGKKNNGYYFGHTGVFAGNDQMYHVYGGGKVQLTAIPRSVYDVLGYVRPSGVGEQVADCEFEYNKGREPGKPVTIATGPHGGEKSGEPPSTKPPPRPTADPNAPSNPQSAGSRGDYKAYLDALAQSESAGGGCNNHGSKVGYNGQTGPGYKCVNSLGYMGRYQMGLPALDDVGCVAGKRWKNCLGFTVKGAGDFLNNPELQEKAIRAYNNIQYGYTKAVHGYLGTYVGSLRITPSGLLAGAHLVGHSPAKAYVRTHGRSAASDANGVRVQDYMKKLGGFTLDPNWSANAFNEMGLGGDSGGPEEGYPFPDQSDYYTPSPPRPVREVIAEIRQRAGVKPIDIGHDPSYNEIMLAMTKERFFDPRFFANIAGSVPAMQNNQGALEAYISMTLQDIGMLQEQINALIAARASLRLEELNNKNAP